MAPPSSQRSFEPMEARAPEHRSWHLSAGWLSVVELLVLGPLAAILVLGLIPSAFEIEWACIGPRGIEGTAGDTYAAAFGVVGTLGWFAVLAAAIYAEIVGARRLAVLLPVIWFAVLVSTALIAAAAIGPQLCPI